MVDIVIIAATAFGVLSVVVGLRGRQIDAHPHCAKCGYDLVSSVLSPDRCPECGAGLAGRRALRQGRRQMRWLHVSLGVLLLLLASVLNLTMARVIVIPESAKPLWLLQRELHDSRDVVAVAAAQEIMSRLVDEELSRHDISSITAHIVELQSDQTGRWIGEYGDFVEAARSMGLVSDDAWHDYMRTAVRVGLARTWVLDRGNVTLPPLLIDRRATPSTSLFLDFSHEGSSIDNEPLMLMRRGIYGGLQNRFSFSQQAAERVLALDLLEGIDGASDHPVATTLRGLAVGRHTLRTSWRIKISERSARSDIVDAWSVTAVCDIEVR